MIFLLHGNAKACVIGEDRRKGDPIPVGGITCELGYFVQKFEQYWERCDQNGNWFDIYPPSTYEEVVTGPQCQKCVGSSIVNDDSQDPGMCKKCQNGAAVNDDSESCDDFDPCTTGDHCSGGACVGTPIENPSPSSPDCQ